MKAYELVGKKECQLYANELETSIIQEALRGLISVQKKKRVFNSDKLHPKARIKIEAAEQILFALHPLWG